MSIFLCVCVFYVRAHDNTYGALILLVFIKLKIYIDKFIWKMFFWISWSKNDILNLCSKERMSERDRVWERHTKSVRERCRMWDIQRECVGERESMNICLMFLRLVISYQWHILQTWDQLLSHMANSSCHRWFSFLLPFSKPYLQFCLNTDYTGR